MILWLALLLLPGKPLPIEAKPEPIRIGQTVLVNCGWWQQGNHQQYRGIGRVVSVEGTSVEVETRDGFYFVTPGECKRVKP